MNLRIVLFLLVFSGFLQAEVTLNPYIGQQAVMNGVLSQFGFCRFFERAPAVGTINSTIGSTNFCNPGFECPDVPTVAEYQNAPSTHEQFCVPGDDQPLADGFCRASFVDPPGPGMADFVGILENNCPDGWACPSYGSGWSSTQFNPPGNPSYAWSDGPCVEGSPPINSDIRIGSGLNTPTPIPTAAP